MYSDISGLMGAASAGQGPTNSMITLRRPLPLDWNPQHLQDNVNALRKGPAAGGPLRGGEAAARRRWSGAGLTAQAG
jgi:hypothetical protein